MPIRYKILGQANPSALNTTVLYTVPPSTNTVISTLQICNQGSTGGLFRISAIPYGETANTKNYLAYDTACPGNDSISLTIGMTLGSNDSITVYANSSTMSFNLFGSEMY